MNIFTAIYWAGASMISAWICQPWASMVGMARFRSEMTDMLIYFAIPYLVILVGLKVYEKL